MDDCEKQIIEIEAMKALLLDVAQERNVGLLLDVIVSRLVALPDIAAWIRTKTK